MQDSGTGLEPESLDHLIHGFLRPSRKDMGMGLAISRSIIEGRTAGGCGPYRMMVLV